MRNTTKLFGIIAIVAVIVFSMAGCDNGSPAGPGGEPPPPGFTVTFDSASGSAVANQTGIESGGFAAAPPPPTRAFAPGVGLWAHPMPTATAYTFDGWFAPEALEPFAFATTPITANITLLAHWTAPEMPIALEGTNLVDAAFAYVNANPGAFTLLVGAPATRTAAFAPGANVHLTIAGVGGQQTITRTGTGNLFNVNGEYSSLTLGGYITLAGHSGNNNSLVLVQGGASLTMNAGAQITGNTATGGQQGGGVNVTGAGSTFTMLGGEIRDNRATGATNGAGVRVAAGASFVMHAGAVIEGNTAEENDHSAGGVLLLNAESIFTMLGGEIRGNSATGDTAAVGGARISGGSLQIVNGVIYGYGADNANTGVANDVLLLENNGTAEYGTFVGDNWTPNPDSGGELDSTDDTIRVVNGVLQ